MWEEGVRIYGTPGVPNNFPHSYEFMIFSKKKKKKEFMRFIDLKK